MRNKHNNLEDHYASKTHMNNDMPMCEHQEVNSIQFEGYKDQNSHDSHSHQSHHDRNDSKKLLTELNNDVKNDLEDFKRCIHSMRTVHWKLFARDDGKTTGVLPKKKSKPVNQEPQSKTDFEKLMTKFLDGQRVTNIKIDEGSKSQNVSSKQTDKTNPPPPPQAHTKHVNAVFTGSEKSDDSSKIQKDPPPPIIVSRYCVEEQKNKHEELKLKRKENSAVMLPTDTNNLSRWRDYLSPTSSMSYSSIDKDKYMMKAQAVHRDYLKVTKEHVETLQELLEQARALKPLDENLDHALNIDLELVPTCLINYDLELHDIIKLASTLEHLLNLCHLAIL
ncbi:hypothetical protein Tco_1226663 [Tanacetum coccineum]